LDCIHAVILLCCIKLDYLVLPSKPCLLPNKTFSSLKQQLYLLVTLHSSKPNYIQVSDTQIRRIPLVQW